MDGILFFLSPFLPQMVGFASYLLLKKHNDLIAHLLGVVIPPLASFYFYQYLYRRLFVPYAVDTDLPFPSRGALFLLFGALIQLFFSLMIQLALHHRHKLRVGGRAS